MSVEIVRALLLLSKYCISQDDCGTCPLRAFCGKQPSEW
jgi:hypothetical protein